MRSIQLQCAAASYRARPRPRGGFCQNSPRRFVVGHRRPSCPRPTSRAFGRLETEEPGPLDPVRASQRRFRVATNRRAEPRLQSSLAPDFSHVMRTARCDQPAGARLRQIVFAANGADVSVTPLSTIRSRRRSVSSASTTPDRADATRRSTPAYCCGRPSSRARSSSLAAALASAIKALRAEASAATAFSGSCKTTMSGSGASIVGVAALIGETVGEASHHRADHILLALVGPPAVGASSTRVACATAAAAVGDGGVRLQCGQPSLVDFQPPADGRPTRRAAIGTASIALAVSPPCWPRRAR